MRIVVCVKQVPDTANIMWTENNTMIRDGVESILNPFDEYAVETVLRIRENVTDCAIDVLTMGPPQAADALRRAIAMGVDRAMLLTDKRFAGADTLATSRTLAKAIREKVGEYDLIVCGQFAIDSNTAQTGPGIAEHLGLPQVTYVKEVESVADDSVVVVREVEEGIQRVKMKLPGVICIIKCDYDPRTPSIKGLMKARRTQIPEFDMEVLGLGRSEVGIKGSPTWVSKAFNPGVRKAGEMIDGANPKDAANLLIQKLKEARILVASGG
jgi:electron transfer flavoprotein beta subunit